MSINCIFASVSKHHAMKTCRKVKAKLHVSLNSTLSGR